MISTEQFANLKHLFSVLNIGPVTMKVVERSSPNAGIPDQVSLIFDKDEKLVAQILNGNLVTSSLIAEAINMMPIFLEKVDFFHKVMSTPGFEIVSEMDRLHFENVALKKIVLAIYSAQKNAADWNYPYVDFLVEDYEKTYGEVVK